MKRRPNADPTLMSELFIASCEVMARRSWLMAQNRCSRAEYRRMVTEKVGATHDSLKAIWLSKSAEQILAPWHRRATRNVKRLRRKVK